MHGLDVVLKLLHLVFLLFLNALLLRLNLLLLFFQGIDLFPVLIDSLLKLSLMFTQLLICRLILAGHVSNNCVGAQSLRLVRFVQL